MINISSFVYCEYVQTEFTPRGPRPKVINPLATLEPVAVPSNYSFSTVCCITGFSPDVEYNIQMVFMDPDGNVLKDTTDLKFKIPEKEKVGNIQLNLDARNIILRKEGEYKTKVLMNGECIGEYSIPVIVKGDFYE